MEVGQPGRSTRQYRRNPLQELPSRPSKQSSPGFQTGREVEIAVQYEIAIGTVQVKYVGILLLQSKKSDGINRNCCQSSRAVRRHTGIVLGNCCNSSPVKQTLPSRQEVTGQKIS